MTLTEMQNRNLRKYGIAFNSLYEKNSLKPHGRGEGWAHWLTKAIIFKLLTDRGHEVFTEVKFTRTQRRADIIDLTSGLIFEIETGRGGVKKERMYLSNPVLNDLIVIKSIKTGEEMTTTINNLDNILSKHM